MTHLRPPSEGSKLDLKLGSVRLFAAGGITGCGDWQAEMAESLSDLDFLYINPRREGFDGSDSKMLEHQVFWEYRHLRMANAVSFWFPPDTLCPITLFELGKHLVGDKKLFIGCHPSYGRAFDVRLQAHLENPSIVLARSLPELIGQVRKWIETVTQYPDGRLL